MVFFWASGFDYKPWYCLLFSLLATRKAAMGLTSMPLQMETLECHERALEYESSSNVPDDLLIRNMSYAVDYSIIDRALTLFSDIGRTISDNYSGISI